MGKSDSKVIFLDFSPSEITRDKIRKMFDKIALFAPDKAKIKITLKKHGSIYTGEVVIQSEFVSFKFQEISERLGYLQSKLYSDSLDRLIEWKAYER